MTYGLMVSCTFLGFSSFNLSSTFFIKTVPLSHIQNLEFRQIAIKEMEKISYAKNFQKCWELPGTAQDEKNLTFITLCLADEAFGLKLAAHKFG